MYRHKTPWIDAKLLHLHIMGRCKTLWINSSWLQIQHVSTHASHRSTHPESHTLMYRRILSSCQLILSLVTNMYRRKPYMHRLILSLTSPMCLLIQLEVVTYCYILYKFCISSLIFTMGIILQP